MRVLILAAGYGTRLYPLTQKVPKALIPIGNDCILGYLLNKIDNLRKKYLIKEVRIVSNDKFYKMFVKWCKDNQKENVMVLNDGTSSPQDRRGAIGDIKFGIGEIQDDWLILGADNIFDWELVEFIDFAQEKSPFPVVGVYNAEDPQICKQLGVVVMESDLLKKLVEKPQNPPSTLIATCIYFFPQETLKFMEEYFRTKGETDLAGRYIAWLIENTKVYGYIFKGIWLDIGTKESLEKARRIFSYGA